MVIYFNSTNYFKIKRRISSAKKYNQLHQEKDNYLIKTLKDFYKDSWMISLLTLIKKGTVVSLKKWCSTFFKRAIFCVKEPFLDQ